MHLIADLELPKSAPLTMFWKLIMYIFYKSPSEASHDSNSS